MHKFSHALLVCFVFFAATIQAQTNAQNNQNLLQQLLDLPSPPNNFNEKREKNKEYPPEFYDKNKVPPDDAPLEDLLAYWSVQNSNASNLNYSIKPSARTVERILAACQENSALLTNYLSILPKTPEDADFVKKLYDEEAQNQKNEEYWAGQVKQWLKYNSKYFAEELLKKAQKVRDEKEYVTNQEELLALARVDWDAAQPILERLENDSSQPVSSTLAKWAYYEHAVSSDNRSAAENYRSQLKAVVEDKKAMPGARDLAMDALVHSGNWDGRDEWYVSLLADETLFDLKVNGATFTGLTTLINTSPPEKWIPEMAKLVKSENPAVHNAAVRNLAQLLDEKRKDAVEPLLPWLSNPKWANEIQNERNKLIEAVGAIDVPESVPGLISIVMNEDTDSRAAAAKSLVRYKDSRAVPTLRMALAQEQGEGYRDNIIEALVASGGFSDDEQMSALEAYVTQFSASETSDEMPDSEYEAEQKTVPVQISVGKFLSAQTEPSEGLVVRAIERLKILRKTKPPAAKTLFDIMQNWHSPVFYLEMLRQIGDGKANVDTIINVLAKRKDLREKLPNDLAAMSRLSGTARGVGAIAAEDQIEMLNILGKTDADAQIATLAGARLIRAPLPVQQVSEFLKSPNKLLALAAERYLESEDSAQARTIVLNLHPAEVLILGARSFFNPKGRKTFNASLLNDLFQSVNGTFFFSQDYPKFQKNEDALRAEIKQNPDLQAVFGLMENEAGQQTVIRVFKDKAVYTFQDNEARYWERDLTPKEYEKFYRFLIENKVDALAPIGGEECEECTSSEFVMFGRNGGRRVFIRSNYPRVEPFNKLEEMLASFSKENLKLRYRLADKIKGLEVVLADDNLRARTLWKNVDDFRVLIEDKAREQEISRELLEKQKALQEKVDDDENAQLTQDYEKLQQKRFEGRFDHFGWRKIENGKLGAPVEQPLEVPFLPEKNQSGADFEPGETGTYKTRAGNFIISLGNYENPGIWKTGSSQNPVQVVKGMYAKPVATANGQWVVVAKTDAYWNEPNYVVRVNLRTGKEFKVNLPPADAFFPVAFISPLNKILLYRAPTADVRRKNNPSPKMPEYYLLDAETGAAQSVKGEFKPLEQQTFRPLQAASAPNEFWAAIYDAETKSTEVGRYDEKAFVFKPWIKLPEVAFDSMSLWVDEKNGKIYFIYEGHLLSLPLENQNRSLPAQ